MATNRAVQGRLHVGVVSPWRQAISALFGESRADVGDLEWELPEGCEPGDSVLHVVYSPRPAIVEWDFVEARPGGPDDLDFDRIRFYPDGVSVAAVERRLGYSLPALPATIEPEQAAELERAVGAEEEAPRRGDCSGTTRVATRCSAAAHRLRATAARVVTTRKPSLNAMSSITTRTSPTRERYSCAPGVMTCSTPPCRQVSLTSWAAAGHPARPALPSTRVRWSGAFHRVRRPPGTRSPAAWFPKCRRTTSAETAGCVGPRTTRSSRWSPILHSMSGCGPGLTTSRPTRNPSTSSCASLVGW